MLPKLIPSLQTHRRIGFHGHAVEPAWVIVDFGLEVTPEKIVLFPARPTIAGELLPSSQAGSVISTETAKGGLANCVGGHDRV
jgi:hypothetical protein